MTQIHNIVPGLWCVPAAIYAITGDDPVSVIQPALNRHMGAESLLELVTGSTRYATRKTLSELGWRVRPYKHADRHQVAWWVRQSAEKWPGHVVLLFTSTHALVAKDGRVFDNWAPHGPAGAEHPFARTVVETAWLVERA